MDEITVLNKKINELEKTLKEKEEKINELNNNIKEKENDIIQYQSKITDLIQANKKLTNITLNNDEDVESIKKINLLINGGN